jgi:hypothetical protein
VFGLEKIIIHRMGRKMLCGASVLQPFGFDAAG